MNVKIKNLIKELANELQEQEAGMSLSIVNSKGETIIAQGGSDILVSLGVLEQYEKTKEKMKYCDCDCPGHREVFKGFGIEREYSGEVTEETIKYFTDFLKFLANGMGGTQK